MENIYILFFAVFEAAFLKITCVWSIWLKCIVQAIINSNFWSIGRQSAILVQLHIRPGKEVRLEFD